MEELPFINQYHNYHKELITKYNFKVLTLLNAPLLFTVCVVFHMGYSCWLKLFVNRLMIRISREPLVKIWESQTAHIQSPLSHSGGRGNQSHKWNFDSLVSIPPDGFIITYLSTSWKQNSQETSSNFLNFQIVWLASCLLLLWTIFAVPVPAICL